MKRFYLLIIAIFITLSTHCQNVGDGTVASDSSTIDIEKKAEKYAKIMYDCWVSSGMSESKKELNKIKKLINENGTSAVDTNLLKKSIEKTGVANNKFKECTKSLSGYFTKKEEKLMMPYFIKTMKKLSPEAAKEMHLDE